MLVLEKIPFLHVSSKSAQGRSWSGFRRGWLKGLKIENTPGYEEMELEMWPFEAEKRAVRRMVHGKRAECWCGITAASGWRSGGSAGAEEQENFSQHITSTQDCFKSENSWYEVNLMVSWII